MAEPTLYEQFRERLSCLYRLNPDAVADEVAALGVLAAEVPADCFGELAARAEELIQAYLNSPWKQTERATLEEYFGCLDRASRLLQARGDVADSPDGDGPAAGIPSVALVPRQLYSSLEWCQILSHAEMPHGLILAVAAARRRTDLLSSVIEEMLQLLHRVDRDQSWRWELSFLDRHRGNLDPEVVRDFLRAWRRRSLLPAANQEWTFHWSGDENLERQWPSVVHEADLLLRKQALQCWNSRGTARKGSLVYLKHLLEQGTADEGRLLGWLQQGIAEIGHSVRFFVSVNEWLVSDQPSAERSWQPAALMREIAGIEGLFPPVLLLADLILTIPDGAYQFALAFFGMAGEARQQWRRQLEKHSQETIRRAFLTCLREGRKPETVIRTYCLGDRELCMRLLNELDFGTHEFDSIRQREKVVRSLAVHYASYLEPVLLPEEIGRRYRDLMRVLHEDNLRRLLTPAQFERVQQINALRDLASLAADVRRFLARRRALNTSLEAMIAVEMDFVRSVRHRRLFCVRRLLA